MASTTSNTVPRESYLATVRMNGGCLSCFIMNLLNGRRVATPPLSSVDLAFVMFMVEYFRLEKQVLQRSTRRAVHKGVKRCSYRKPHVSRFTPEVTLVITD